MPTTTRLTLLGLFIALTLPALALEPVRIASKVYAFIGEPGEISRANKGRIGNAGFIVGPTGVVVVDTGVSYRHAKEMLAAIRRITKQPIRLAIVTHAHQEFLLVTRYTASAAPSCLRIAGPSILSALDVTVA